MESFTRKLPGLLNGPKLLLGTGVTSVKSLGLKLDLCKERTLTVWQVRAKDWCWNVQVEQKAKYFLFRQNKSDCNPPEAILSQHETFWFGQILPLEIPVRNTGMLVEKNSTFKRGTSESVEAKSNHQTNKSQHGKGH